jgi:hypothetical protein
MAKKQQTYSSDHWGTPEYEAWAEKTYGPRKADHPTGCQCYTCKKSYEWVKGYQAYIARVHGR